MRGTKRAVMGRWAHKGLPAAAYTAGMHSLGQRVNYDGRAWIYTSPYPSTVPPCGAWGGGQQDRDLLLTQANGFAASVTGGYDGATYHVTRQDDPTPTGTGTPGTLRYGLLASGARWIVFDIDGTFTYVRPRIWMQGNVTIDGRGRDVTLKGITPSTVCLAVDGVRNVIICYVTLWTDSYGTNDDVLTVQKSSGNAVGTTIGDPWDLIWLHHVTFRGGGDGQLDATGPTSSLSRLTLDYCRFGPHPTREALQWAANLGLLGHNNASDNGKATLLGAANGNGDGGDYPDNARFTMHHNHWLGCVQRNPEIRRARVHSYNNVRERWGDPPGVTSPGTGPDSATNPNYHAGYGVSVNNDGEFYSLYDVWKPYAAGEQHVLGTDLAGNPWYMTSPDTQAVQIDVAPNTAPQSYVRVVSPLLLNGATAPQQNAAKTFRGYSYASTTSPYANAGVERYDPTTDWAGGEPPYTYTPETDTTGVLARVPVTAGNFQPWVLA